MAIRCWMITNRNQTAKGKAGNELEERSQRQPRPPIGPPRGEDAANVGSS